MFRECGIIPEGRSVSPWQVSLETRLPDDSVRWCGGVLIRADTVLTTASCAGEVRMQSVCKDEKNFILKGQSHKIFNLQFFHNFTAESESAVRCTLRSFKKTFDHLTPRWDAHHRAF